MRAFNKIFVISLPRCATVSVAKALGILGIPVAHLGRIFGQAAGPLSHVDDRHYELTSLARMRQQIESNDFNLEILRYCQGLADYPACCPKVLTNLDRQFPGSLFINVRRDHSVDRWLQSVQIQFVGSELLAAQAGQDSEHQRFVDLMRRFRFWTFGSETFDAKLYHEAYHQYQIWIRDYFCNRTLDNRTVLLEFADTDLLGTLGFSQICKFLHIDDVPVVAFPSSNEHSLAPKRAFDEALRNGTIQLRESSGIRRNPRA